MSCGHATAPPQPANESPIAVAVAAPFVAPESTLVLTGSGSSDPDGRIALFAWQFGPGSTFVVVTTGDTSITAPAGVLDDFPCALRVTDNEGASALDTVHVRVTWLKSPNGGEVYHVGDTLTVELFAVTDPLGLTLTIERGSDLLLLAIPGLGSSIVPYSTPRVSFVVPATVYDAAYGGAVSIVSDSCRILVHEYTDFNNNISSVGYFSIVP